MQGYLRQSEPECNRERGPQLEQTATHVRVEFTDDFVISVSRRQLIRRVGRGLVIGFTGSVVGWLVARLLAIEWLQGSFAAIGVLFLFVAAMSITRQRNALKQFDGIADRTVTYTFESDGYSVQSPFGIGRYNWQFIRRLEEWPDYWLLHQRDGRTLFLPISQVDFDLATLLRSKLASGRTG
jgi:hypothetical protein